MALIYKVLAGALSKAEISKSTEDSVWEIGLDGRETRKAKAPKTDKQPAYFDTLEGAKTFLLGAAKSGVEEAARRLEAAKARYQAIADLAE